MANQGVVNVTDTVSARFGNDANDPQSFRNITLQNLDTTNNIYFSWETADASTSVRLAPGESICTAHPNLPETFKGKMNKGLTAICSSGETAELRWHA